MSTVVGITVLITTCACLIWLAVRARRIRNALLRWSGACMATLAAAAVSVLLGLSISRHRERDPPYNLENT